MCVPVSSLDSSRDVDDDHPRIIWPRLNWATEDCCQTYILILALDDCFTSRAIYVIWKAVMQG